MRKTIATLALVALMPGLLGGCALLGLGKSKPQIEAMSTLPQGDEAYIRFEEGRAALDNGHYAAAIVAYSEARSEPDLLAPSLNGMAVAYSRLGRLDLAGRYFAQAVAADPDDERFRNNLALLRRQEMEEMARRTIVEPDFSTVAPARTMFADGLPLRLVTGDAAIAPRLTVTQPVSRLERISPSRVELTTLVTEPPRNAAQVRIRFAGRDDQATQPAGYPVRISLARVEANSRIERASPLPVATAPLASLSRP